MRWQDGYPCDSGSTDGQDSARLIGILAVFGYPIDKLKYSAYINHGPGPYYLRHPVEQNKYEYSRDQLICYVAGLYFLKMDYLSYGVYQPDNGDWLSPSQESHVRRVCSGYNPTLIGNLWLWLDVLWSSFIDPMAEPNQLICMMKVHPNKAYLKFWCKWNKQWAKSIRNYWSENEGAWRGEPELAELMIKTIEDDVK